VSPYPSAVVSVDWPRAISVNVGRLPTIQHPHVSTSYRRIATHSGSGKAIERRPLGSSVQVGAQPRVGDRAVVRTQRGFAAIRGPRKARVRWGRPLGRRLKHPNLCNCWFMTNEYTRHWFDVFLDTMPESLTAFEVDAIMERLPLPAFENVLDICCGPARHAQLLAKHGYKVTGIDRDTEAVRRAAELVPAGTFVELDQRELTTLDSSFDGQSSCGRASGSSRLGPTIKYLPTLRASCAPAVACFWTCFIESSSSRIKGARPRPAILVVRQSATRCSATD